MNVIARIPRMLIPAVAIALLAATALTMNAALSAPLPPAAEGNVHVNHVDLHYRILGDGEPIVFIHGLMGNYQMWDPYLKSLSENHRVLTYSRRYNWPNLNKFAITKDPLENEVNDLYWLLRNRKIRTANLVGDSYGAMIALSFAAKHPMIVKSLTLIEPPLTRWLVDEPGQADAWQNFVDNAYVPAKRDLLNGKADSATRTFLNWQQPGSGDALAPAETVAVYASNNDLKAVLTAKGGFPNVDRLDVRKIRMPVLVIEAEKSPTLFDSIAREVAALSGGGPVTTIANNGHDVASSQPDAVQKEIATFIAGQKPKP